MYKYIKGEREKIEENLRLEWNRLDSGAMLIFFYHPYIIRKRIFSESENFHLFTE